MKKFKRFTALLLSVAMCLGLFAVGNSALADADNYFVVRRCNSDGTNDPTESNFSFDTLSEVLTHVTSAGYYKVTVYGSPSGINPVTVDKAGVTFEISGNSSATFKTPMILAGNTELIVNGLTMKVSGNNAIVVRDTSKLTLNSGAAVTGSPYGVYQTGGTVVFNGGAVSDYNKTGGDMSGSPKYLPAATPTPTPTATWKPVWPTASPTVSVTGVSLSAKSLLLDEGETYQLRATVNPSNATNKNITWSSSNTSVATVSSSGLIRAHRAGKATITVRTNDRGYTASCSVTVSTIDYDQDYDDTADYIDANITYYVGNKQVYGVTTKSNSRIYIRPYSTSNSSVNRVSFPADALTDMGDDGYSCVRYDLPSVDIEIYRSMASGLGGDDFTLGVRKITPTGNMKTQWNKIKSKNLNGPWTITSNSSRKGLVLRFDMPKYYKKASVRLVVWNGSRFVNVNSNNYSVVRSGSQYIVRTDVTMVPGTYALIRK